MRSLALASLVVVLVVGACALAAADTSAQLDVTTPKQKWALLFDFEFYKKTYKKSYSSMVEEVMRRTYFFPRAWRALASAVAYMFRRQKYHLGLNHMSDWTPKELDRMKNRVLNDGDENQNYESVEIDIAPEELRAKLASMKQEMPEIKEVHEKQREVLSRRRRSATTDQYNGENSTPRIVNYNALINTGAGSKLLEGSEIAFEENLNSKPLKEQIRKSKYFKYPYKDQASKERVIAQVKQRLRKSIAERKARDPAPELKGKNDKDIVFVDLSQSGCFDLPRDQGDCGSCWVFAGIAMLEFLYCKKTGLLTQFSEQYVVDCGKPYIKNADGCEGGDLVPFLSFVRSFGIELRVDYPYVAREQQCPIDKTTKDITTTGWLRFESEKTFVVPIELWEEYLHFGPLFVRIKTAHDFKEYSYGVHEINSHNNSKAYRHGMVLVGHGIQDGVEYWKLRNSYSVGWGEQGYYRVSKRSSEAFFTPVGFAFASMDGFNYQWDEIKKNEKHDFEKVRKFYWDTASKRAD